VWRPSWEPASPCPEIRTFHSLGLSILSEHDGRGWKAAGWSVAPKLLSEDGSAFADFWQSRFRDGSCPPPSPGEWTRMLAEWGDPERMRRLSRTPEACDFRRHLEAWMDWEAWKRRLCIAEMHDLVSGALLALGKRSRIVSKLECAFEDTFCRRIPGHRPDPIQPRKTAVGGIPAASCGGRRRPGDLRIPGRRHPQHPGLETRPPPTDGF
jgi:hypothetical protein